jgi:EAL domain-containing protein (putative c-di-GMP-specific phosphodiesterase class I)
MHHTKDRYVPLFTPRFHLADATMVGMEVNVKRGQKLLKAQDTFKLIQSGNEKPLLADIHAHLSKWLHKSGRPIYLSWGLAHQTKPNDLKLFLDELTSSLPSVPLEIVIDARDQEGYQALEQSRPLFEILRKRQIRVGLFHARLFEFNSKGISEYIDVFKIKKGAIMEMREDLSIASQAYGVIEKLNAEHIQIIADDLYSKSDVTCAILMGIKYGQGYFLSRNQARLKKAVKAPTKKTGNNFYQCRMDYFSDIIWI